MGCYQPIGLKNDGEFWFFERLFTFKLASRIRHGYLLFVIARCLQHLGFVWPLFLAGLVVLMATL